MNDSELEQELRSLQPRAPSFSLEERIARQLEPVGGGLRVALTEMTSSLFRRIFPPMAWASAGAAAALAFVAVSGRLSQPVPDHGSTLPTFRKPTPVTFHPVAATEVILSATDEGLELGSNDVEPLRRLRVNSIERRTWSNPETGVELQIERPREEIYLTSLAIQ